MVENNSISLTLNKSTQTIPERPLYPVRTTGRSDILEGSWIKCDSCGEIIYKEDVISNLGICSKCDRHFKISAKERIDLIIDGGYTNFTEFDKDMTTQNPLDFPEYEEKIKELSKKTGINEAVITGVGDICGRKTVLCTMDSNFLMGSMGSVVGEKITRAVERAIEQSLPLVIIVVSGGARMQEGIISLMQMAKTSAALSRFAKTGQVYITVLTDPTTGGVSASFAMLGDIILAEPQALIGFTGPRVIAQTIKQTLPDGFQTSEFLLQHGFIDKIVHRKELKNTLAKLLELHETVKESDER